MNRKNEYTDTVRDLKAMVRREADDEKRRELSENLDKMAAQLERQRDWYKDLAVLTERVDGLVWLVRGVLVVCAIEVVAGVIVALLVKGHTA
jgi:hypothetical protein